MTTTPPIAWCNHALSGHAPRDCALVRTQTIYGADGQPAGEVFSCNLCDLEAARAKRAERLHSQDSDEG